MTRSEGRLKRSDSSILLTTKLTTLLALITDFSFIPKVVIDQTTWGPFWNNVYILMLGAMQLRPSKDVFKEMKDTTVPLIISGLKLWPLAHCITYGVVPVENRLLWVDLVEIIWVTVLANKAAESMEGAIKGETTNSRNQ